MINFEVFLTHLTKLQPYKYPKNLIGGLTDNDTMP